MQKWQTMQPTVLSRTKEYFDMGDFLSLLNTLWTSAHQLKLMVLNILAGFHIMISDFLHLFVKSFLSFIRTQFKIKVTQWTSSILNFIQMVKKT